MLAFLAADFTQKDCHPQKKRDVRAWGNHLSSCIQKIKILYHNYNLNVVINYEAQTQHQRCCTSVRCGDVPRTPLLARLAASGLVDSMCFKPIRIDAAPTRADSRGIGPT